jgi:hypothetical protein
LSPNFKKDNSKNQSKQKRKDELMNGNNKINLNNSSTTKSLKNSVKKEGKM